MEKAIRKCIFDGKELSNESPEHVLLQAFGGRKTATQVICTECNLRLGNNIDKPFAQAFAAVLNAAHIRSGNGDPPPMLRNVSSPDGRRRVDLLPGLSPRDLVYRREPHDGRTRVQIAVSSLEQLTSQIGNFAKGIKLSREQFINLLGTVPAREYSTVIKDGLGFDVLLEGAHYRAVTKAVLVLWAIHTSNEEVVSGPLDRAIAYVNTPGTDAQLVPADWMARLNFAPFPFPREARFGPDQLTHSIVAWSNRVGRLVGFYQLFGNIGYSIRLAYAGCTPNTGIVLHHNPLTEEWDCRNLTSSERLPCEIVDTVAVGDEDCRGAKERIERVIALHRTARANAVSRSESPADLAERVAQFVFGGEIEREIDPAEIVAKLREVLSTETKRDSLE